MSMKKVDAEGVSVMERSGDAEEIASYHNPLAVRVYLDLTYYVQRVGFWQGSGREIGLQTVNSG
jgi:hypothetical protein